MKTLSVTGLAFAASVIAASATAKPPEPPMNGFNYAFYTCENGNAFQMSYNSDDPTEATLTTSNNNKQYPLKRSEVDKGVQFSNQKITFWTDGETTTIRGTEIPLNNCKLKASAS